MNQVTLREYIESILAEQRQALRVAEEEREKSAAALRKEVDRAVREGDERLREHIANQISQIRGDLISSEKLELTRIEKVEAQVRSASREIQIVLDASRQAIEKAEHANDRRLDLLNEFRAQQSDEAKKYLQRSEHASFKEQVTDRLSGMELRQARAESRAATYAAAILIFVAIVGVAVRFL